ncbi:asparagine--tRNA ligase [Candidatus Micrarchaeota archaeon]|nr:asparagine--tRNA ligase [Candidatus Micrarchaeota archaeon]
MKISEAFEAKPGERVRLRGWIYRTRSSGGVVFAVLRDSTGVIQVAVKKENVPQGDFDAATRALIESSISVEGSVREDKRAPGGREVEAKGFEVIQFSHPFPIAKDQSTEFLLDVRHLWLRSQKMTNVMKARGKIVRYLREFFDENDFWEVTPPIITKNECEGGATLFEFNYFGQRAFLSQSAQLYNEAFITALEKVFVLAPSFRAEKSRTLKHLTEYWHLEEEAAFFDNEDNMRLQEEMVSYACNKLAKNDAALLKLLERDPKALAEVKPPFHRLSYDEALKKLEEKGAKIEWGDDLGTEEEKLLTQGLKKPVFVYNWPKKTKPFYMEVHPTKNEYVLNSDLLAPDGHGEIIGGSQRIWEYDKLLQRLKEEGLSAKDYEWYLDLRKYGSVPHSGFGLGIERLVKWILNLEHIRDAIPFPRVINRAYP